MQFLETLYSSTPALLTSLLLLAGLGIVILRRKHKTMKPWSEIQSHYFPPGTKCKFEHAKGGHTNLTQYVITTNQELVLRVYLNDDPIDKILYEIEVLKSLQSHSFSFQTPRIYPTLQQKDYITLADGKRAIMFYRIPGGNLDEKNLQHVTKMGKVAGELINRMGALKVSMACPSAPFHKIYQRHPLVPNEEVLTKVLKSSIFDEMRDASDFLLKECLNVEKAVEPIYDKLPKQIIHRDLWIGNMLVNEEGEITAVLDLEFSGPDLRVFDVAACIVRFSLQENCWEHYQAFLEGFKQTGSLTEEEIERLPVLTRWIILSVLVRCVGRYLNGIDSPKALTDRLLTYYQRVQFFDENKDKIVKLFSEAILAKKERKSKND